MLARSRPATLDQQLIAGRVSQAIVDQFELIQIDKQYREMQLLATRRFDGRLQPVDKVQAVGNAGERSAVFPSVTSVCEPAMRTTLPLPSRMAMPRLSVQI